MKRTAFAIALLLAFIVAGTLYAQQRRNRLQQPAAQPKATVTLYDGSGKAIKTWQVLAETATHNTEIATMGETYCFVGQGGGFSNFTDSTGQKVSVSGSVVVEGSFR